jgi:predicted MFS family arabinose efflux permease
MIITTLANTTPLATDAAKLALAVTANITTFNSTITCSLSPHARALSSVLTGFVCAIFIGLSGGFYVAFMIGWVCWFALLRNVLIGIYQVYSVVRLELPEGGEHFFTFLDHFTKHDLRGWNSDFFRGDVVEEVTFLG